MTKRPPGQQVHDHLVSAFTGDHKTKLHPVDALPLEWPAIRALLDKQFRTETDAIVWFTTPKVALGHKTPLQVFRTSDGCETIIRLLETLYD